MPDTRTHRGPHSDDHRLFGAGALPALTSAVRDLSWLLSRGYALPSALKLVGDRYQLEQRQRIAVTRSACSDESLRNRLARQLALDQLGGHTLQVDAYNVLTTVEASLGGAVILAGRDGSFRDLVSMHGTWRKVAETTPALAAVGDVLASTGVIKVIWLLDQPVSNSGRLKQLIEAVGLRHHWPWQARLVRDPDRLLVMSTDPVATADSAVLDRAAAWVNLARGVVEQRAPGAWQLDLTGTAWGKASGPVAGPGPRDLSHPAPDQ